MGRERGIQRQDAQVISLFTGVAFTALLMFAIAAIALGATKYSVVLSLTCIALPLLGFTLAWLVFFRTRSFSRRCLRLELEKNKLRPGEVLSGTLILTLDRSRHMRSLQVRVWGGERTAIVESYGKHAAKYVEESAWIDRDLEIVPEGLTSSSAIHRPDRSRTPAGTYRYHFEVVIPNDAVPCWSGNSVNVMAFVRARAYFALGPDAVQDKHFVVLHPHGEDGSNPHSFTVEKEKLLSGVYGIQVRLNGRSARPGGTISGAVSIAAENPDRVREVRVQLVEWERATAQGHSSIIPKVRSSCSIPMAGGLPVALPFRLPVPVDVKPSVNGRISNLTHTVRVRLDLKLSKDVIAEDSVVILPKES